MSELEHKRRAGPATEAEVAGRLLVAAKPQPDAAREAALLERIMAATERRPRLAAVTPSPAPIVSAARSATAVSMQSRRSPARRDLWTAASVLAASLVIGFMAGQSPLSHAAVHSVAEASGVSFASATQDVATVLAAAEFGDDD